MLKLVYVFRLIYIRSKFGAAPGAMAAFKFMFQQYPLYIACPLPADLFVRGRNTVPLTQNKLINFAGKKESRRDRD